MNEHDSRVTTKKRKRLRKKIEKLEKMLQNDIENNVNDITTLGIAIMLKEAKEKFSSLVK